MSRTPDRHVPRLEWLEDRSVPSVSPVNARLDLAPPDRPDRVEVVETVQRLNDVIDSRPALHATLNQLTAGETVALVNAVASADNVNAKVIRDIVADIRDGATPDTGADDITDAPSPRQLSKVERVAALPTPPLLGLLTAAFRADLTLPTLNLSPGATPAAAAASSAEASGGETVSATHTPPVEAARPKDVAIVRAVSPGTAQPAELLAVEEAAAVVAAAGDPEVVAAPAPELLAARLTTDGSGLEAFVASLDRFGQVLGLPEGASFPSWVVATALALATCEVARRQSRAARRTRTLTPADDTDTLSWSWTTL